VPRTGPTAGCGTTARLLRVDDLEVEVMVRRVRRMNLGVHPPEGRVRLSVPPRTSDRAVARFVRDSRVWIERHRERIRQEQRAAELRPAPPVRVGAEGELWWHFGEPLQLAVVAASGRPRVSPCPEARLEVSVADPADRDAVLRALDRWQRSELRAAAEPMLADWCTRIGVRHEFLGLRRMSTRWGTCVPARRRIWLNVALVEHAADLLEYVVVHEAVHLLEASHGVTFRALMDRHLPDWRDRRRRLDAGGTPVRGSGPDDGRVPAEYLS